jgi:glycosyltransferase involved in cell wall biosynthesis
VLYFKPGDEKDLADRILELYHSPGKSAALASSAQTLYRQYHWPVMKQRYLKVYQKLLG